MYTKKKVDRYYCNACGKSYAQKRSVLNHIQHCWYVTENRTCKTCAHCIDRKCAIGIGGTDVKYCDIVVMCKLWQGKDEADGQK